MNRALTCIRTASALAMAALAVAGCAAANNAMSSQAQNEQTMYGLSSDGPTTDLYTELFGPRQPPAAPATTVASAQPGQPVTTQPMPPVQQAQQYPATQQYQTARPGQTATAAPGRPNQAQATSRMPQPAYGQPAAQPVQVAQQPAPPPAPPPEPDVPAAYGITANGPTTDLYTEIFGPRHSNNQ